MKQNIKVAGVFSVKKIFSGIMRDVKGLMRVKMPQNTIFNLVTCQVKGFK